MYTRSDISMDQRLEIFSQFWRFGDRHGFVSELAAQQQVSRHFIYDLASRVRQALDWQRPGRKPVSPHREEAAQLRQRLRELQSEVETLRGELAIERQDRSERRLRLLLELALCPVSESKISRCLGAAFGAAPSVGWVNQQLQRAGAAALRVMQRREVRESLEEVALDELFSGGKPILTLVEPQTLMAVVPETRADRKGETWQQVLAQYPHVKLAISDQGSGLLKGVAGRGGIEHQVDVFHFKRNLRREVRRLESRCYEAIAELDAARKLTQRRRLLDTARLQAGIEYRQKAAALDRLLLAFDWLEVIVAYLEEQLEPFDRRRKRRRRYEEAQAAVEEVLALLDDIHEIKVAAIVTLIEQARERLFTFLRVLERRLQAIPIAWRKITGSREALWSAVARVWYWRGRAGRGARELHEYLTALLGLEYWSRRVENLSEIIAGVEAALERVVRASSAVECLNSILRPYTSVKKRLSQSYLGLVALYWNLHPLPQRGRRTPFAEAGVDLGSDDWVELIEREMQRSAAAPAAIN